MSDEVVEMPVVTDAPDTSVNQEQSESSDNDEAEYEAAMAKIRGEDKSKPKDKPKSKEEYEAEEQEKEAASKEPAESETKEKKEEPKDRSFKLKVNGQEIEMPEAEVIKNAQLGVVATQKLQQAAGIRKQAEQFIQALQSNPESVLAHPSLGIDLEAFAEKILYNKIQQQTNPEEYQRTQEQKELEQYRAEKAEREQEAKQKQQEEMKEHYRQDWSRKFTEALDTYGLPKTDWTITRMASYMRQALQKGYKHIQPKDVVDYVKQDWIQAQKQLFQHMDGNKMIEVLGKEAADKIRKANLQKYQGKQEQPMRAKSNREPSQEQQYGSLEEMREAMLKQR